MKPGESLASLSAEEKRVLLARVLRERAQGEQPKQAPLSYAQERMWLLHELNPEGSAFNLHYALVLKGKLDVPALEQALNDLIVRHEALRTAFHSKDGRPSQAIFPAKRFTLAFHDFTTIPGEGAWEAMREATIGERRKPFRLDDGGLFRASLYRLAPPAHVLFLVIHHIIADGWSIGLLIEELASHYGSRVKGKAAVLPPLPIQYADFARWQRGWLQGDVLESQLGYWRGQLAGVPPQFDLPSDGVRVANPSGATQTCSLSVDLTRALKSLAQSESATLFMVLLAGLQVLLWRISGQDDFTIGTPIAGRTRRETEGMIGFFVNMLVLRANVAGKESFRKLLSRVRATALEAFDHQDLPFERLLEDLHPDRDLMRTPLFQIYFNMLNFQQRSINFPGLTAEVLSPLEADPNFDLTLYVREDTGTMDLSFLYRTDLFTHQRIEHLLEQLTVILETAAEEPTRPIGDMSLVTPLAKAITPDPLQPLRTDCNETVLGRFLDRLQKGSDRLAVVEPGGQWTYGDVERSSTRLAAALRTAGVAGTDVVAVLAHRSATVVPVLLGIAKAGAKFCVLDSALPAPRMVECLAAAGPSALIQLDGVSQTNPLLEEALSGVSLKYRARFPADLAGSATDDFANASDRPCGGPGGYIAFTSGTTGGVKAIVGTHGPVAHFLSWYARTFDLGEQDRFSMLSGLSHDPLLRDVFAPLWVGGTLCVPNPEDLLNPTRIRAWMAREGVTVGHLTPPLARVLTEDAGGGELPNLRLVCLGGDVLTSEVVRSLRRVAPRARIVNFYGATETPQAMGWYEVPTDGDDRSGGTIPIGRGIDDVQLLVLTENGQLAGVGELGEIVIRTAHLARGYLGDEALTRARFVTNPFTEDPDDRIYRTGDLGRFSPDGLVEFCGRRDGQVKIRGYRVELGEVEAAAAQVPGVKQAVVVARGETGADKRLVGYVVGADGLTSRTMRNALAARLPDYMVPSAWVFLDGLPLTPNGKVDRRNLPDPGAQIVGAEHYMAPRTQTEESLVAIWKEVLKIERVGVENNFFDLGGHSLLVMQVVSRAERLLGLALPVRNFFELPTIAALAAEFDRRGPQARAVSPNNEIKVAARGAHRVRVAALDPLVGKERTR